MERKSLFYIIILVTIELLSVTSLKYWSTTKNNLFLYLGLLGYLLVGAIFAYILYIHSQMTVVNSLWQVLNVILVSAVGLLIFKEKITPKQMVGVVLAIMATVLLALD
jgi:multidrug transporter EmrE-like cation transporter